MKLFMMILAWSRQDSLNLWHLLTMDMVPACTTCFLNEKFSLLVCKMIKNDYIKWYSLYWNSFDHWHNYLIGKVYIVVVINYFKIYKEPISKWLLSPTCVSSCRVQISVAFNPWNVFNHKYPKFQGLMHWKIIGNAQRNSIHNECIILALLCLKE